MTALFVGDVDSVPVGFGHLPFAAGLAREKAFAHVGFRAAAERHALLEMLCTPRGRRLT